MSSWLRRHRPFVVLSASALGLLALAAAAGIIFGRDLIVAANEGRSLGALNRFFAGSLEQAHKRGADRFGAFLACGLALYALAALVYAAARARRSWRLLLILLPVWYLAVELFVAPHLVRTLQLVHYYIIQDPDHRPSVPPGGAAGWNSDGLRASPESEAYREEDLNLIFLGDSFTLGMKIGDDRETFACRVQAALDAAHPDLQVRVANFGWTSSSPLLSYRRLVDIGARYRPDLVCLFIDMTDFHDDVKWKHMLERRGIYWFYDKLPLTLELLENLLPGLYWRLWRRSNDGLPRQRYFITEQPLEVSRPFMEPMMESVERIHAWCQARGAAFALFILPRSYQYSESECPEDYEVDLPGREHAILGPHCLEPFRYFEAVTERVPYPVHSLLSDFRDTDRHPHCFEADPHWNALGHEIAAEAILRALAPQIERLLD